MKKSTIAEVISSLLILLFAYAAFVKLSDHEMFYAQLIKFPLLGSAPFFFSCFIPFVELVAAAMLFVPKLKTYGFLASVLLLATFTIFLVLMVMLKSDLPCSCGGVIARLSWTQHIIFNLFFLGLAVIGLGINQINFWSLK